MSYTVDENRSGGGAFMNIFSLESADDDKARIARQLDHVTNYNSINDNTHTRTSSMETVWAYDVDASNEASGEGSSNQTAAEDGTNFGIPSMLQTTHMETEYDPYSFGNADKPTSFWHTVIHLILVSGGPAILSVPMFFMEVGYGLGIFATFAVIYLYACSMKTLLWSEYQVCKLKRIPNISYPDLIYFAFKDGPPSFRWFAGCGRYIIDVTFIVVWASACCFGVVLSAENISLVYNQWTHKHTDVQVVMGWIFIPILLLCWVRKFKYLVPASVVANIANVLCVGMVIYDATFGKKPFKRVPAVGSTSQLPVFLGALFFTVNATGLMLPLKREMKEPGRFKSVITATYVPVSLMYAIFALICTLKYGSSLKDTVTQNVQQGHRLSQYMMLANALSLILQYPLLAYVIFDVIWNSLMKVNKKTRISLLVWEYVLRTAITIVVFLSCYILPGIELFLILGGNVGTMIDSLLFPAFIQVVVTWRVSKNKRTFHRCVLKNMAMCILALVILVSGVDSCVRAILQHYGAKSTQ